MSRTVLVTASIEDLFVAAAREIVRITEDCRKEGRACFIALAGGSTPRGLYRLLASEPYRSQIDWGHVRIFWGDERMVPPDHQESNFRMAQEALLSHVPIPSTHVFRIEGELPPQEAAVRYEAVLQQQFTLLPGDVPRFDLILLGMGPDGHTASLFPGTSAVSESRALVASPWVEKFRTYRVTLTPPVINAAKHVLFLVGGLDKALVLQAVLEGPENFAKYPAQAISPATGQLVWLVNQDAAGLLQPRTIASHV